VLLFSLFIHIGKECLKHLALSSLNFTQFEFEQQTDINIQTIDAAKRACTELNQIGPTLVFISSFELCDTMAILATMQKCV